jgi:hypothetical protein
MAVVAPGGLLILSSLVWIPPYTWPRLLDTQNHEQSLFVTSSFLLISYVVGLVLSAWAVQGWLLYIRLAELIPTRSRFLKVPSRVVLGFFVRSSSTALFRDRARNLRDVGIDQTNHDYAGRPRSERRPEAL